MKEKLEPQGKEERMVFTVDALKEKQYRRKCMRRELTSVEYQLMDIQKELVNTVREEHHRQLTENKIIKLC